MTFEFLTQIVMLQEEINIPEQSDRDFRLLFLNIQEEKNKRVKQFEKAVI